MNKLILALALAGVSTLANTATYTIDVEVSAITTPLSYRQITPMGFPIIEVSDATQVGAQCTSTADNFLGFDNMPADLTNSLCPSMIGNEAMIELQGAPNASISYTVTAASQLSDGLSFDITGNGSAIVTYIDAGGLLAVPLEGVLTLENKAEVNSGTLNYSYDFVAAYQ